MINAKQKIILGILGTIAIIIVPGSLVVITLWALYKA